MTTIHEGPRFTVKRGEFDGKTREWVEAPDVVAMLAYDDEQIYLIRQLRYPTGRDDLLEVPAGTMDKEGEEPLDAAKRELVEEIGMEADDWRYVTSFLSTSGLSDECVHVYVATGLRKVAEPDADGEEGITLVTWPLDDIDGLIDGNADAKTLISLLWLRREQLRRSGGTAGR